MMIRLGRKNVNNEIKRAIKMAPIDATVLLLQTITRPVYNKQDKKVMELLDTAFHYFDSLDSAKRFASEEYMDTEKGYSLEVSMPMFLHKVKAYQVELGSFTITNYIIPLK